MLRPTIVIGLGGTGQWVLTFLKKELLEIGGGIMPSGVKLLCFDTTSKTTAKTGQGGRRDNNEESVKSGSVELAEGKEFFSIGGNISQLVTEIAAGKHSHLQWFPAKSFLSKLPAAAFNTKEGSGQIRHMGRLSVFRDLSALQKSEIVSRLRAAIQDVQKMVSRDSQLEIVIVGSLAGGTGAGMLIDMAILTREQAARLVANNYVVRGFFVLPRAFTASGIGEGREMLARSFAAWRELDRFMIVGERYGVRQINYHEQIKDLRIEVNRRAFDVSYMVDPARQSVNSLDGVKAEEGLFPAIAQVISLIMDEKAGKAYTEFVTTNLAGKLAQLPRHPYHSAVGSYTIKMPVYYAQEKFSHQLALDVLKEFLAPELNDKRRVYRVSEVRNQEPTAAQPGWTSVRNFMGSSNFNVDGNEIPNTMFLPMVSGIRDKNALRENAIVQEWARGGLTQGQSGVLVSLTKIGQDEEGKLISRNINDELQIPIWRDVPPSRKAGDTPDQAFPRIRAKVADVRAEHYGVDTAGGERLRGKYGKALEQARNSQIARYKKFLRAWTVTNLNGLNSDPRLARGGKIGYVRAFYDELANTFSYFSEFLNKVRLVRNEELRLAARTHEAAERALKTYEMERRKTTVFAFFDDFVHPDAHRAQRNYLRAVQRDIDVRKDDILLDVLAETAGEMEKIARNTLIEIDNWIAHLAVGDPNLVIEGLYPVAMQSLDNVNVNHELDKRSGKVIKIIGEHEYQPDAAYIADAIKSLRWDVSINDKSLSLACGVDMPAAEQEKSAKYMPFQRTGERPEAYNLGLILKLAERPYAVLHNEQPLAKEIIEMYPSSGKLADEINGLAEPLYLASSMAQGPQVVSCFIRVNSNIDETTVRYFAEFEEEMKNRNLQVKGLSLTLVDSEDYYKMNLLRSDNLMPSSDFEMWHKCRDAYIAQVTDPHRGISSAEMHVFPAEINACYYESQIPTILGKIYRTLSPEVVSLLEDREQFEIFVHAISFGLVKKDESLNWIYKLSPGDEDLHLTFNDNRLSKNQSTDDIFDVIYSFLQGSDVRDVFRTINCDNLRNIIIEKQHSLGATNLIKIYRYQLENPNGIIQNILLDAANRRSVFLDEKSRRSIGQEYEDLADLITVILMQAINSFRESSDIKPEASALKERYFKRGDVYRSHVPVSDPSNFFGRTAVVNDLILRLHNGQAIGLFGLRKIGKSSLLQYLRSTARFPVARVDLQVDSNFHVIFDRALKSWYESAQALKIIWSPSTPHSSLDITTRFRDDVERLYNISVNEGKNIPVLLIDEIELVFPKNDDQNRIENYLSFSRILRGLVQEKKIGVLFVGVDSTINHLYRVGTEQNPFYQFLFEQYLGPIGREDCDDMVATIGDQVMLSYSDEALKETFMASGGHPFIARQICATTCDSLLPEQKIISVDDIKKASKKFISQTTTSVILNEQGLWSELTNSALWGSELVDEFQRILMLLAQKACLSKEKILARSKDKLVGERAIQEMEMRGILNTSEDLCKINFGVFRDWIKKYILQG